MKGPQFETDEVDEHRGWPQTRRQNLQVLGWLGTGLLLSAPARAAHVLSSPDLEGFQWLADKLDRSDITTGTTRNSVLGALPMQLTIRLFEHRGQLGRVPASGVMVGIWHCDAAGEYSDNIGQHFLHGYQVSGSDGAITFHTIFPGQHRGRATHMYLSVCKPAPASRRCETVSTQLFFDDSFTDKVHRQHALYNISGTPNMRNIDDPVYRATNAPVIQTSMLADGIVAGEVTLLLGDLASAA